uniref:Ubiquitin carboxyl-terminal hydrolase n=2 Tax=Rhipicephalus microplus TaxID=6941 RepID=A0A6M2CZP5_RHIMP
MASGSKWVPLESNPEVITKFAHKLGLPADWSFVDVLGLDDDFLAMVPQPVAALLFLFPITDKYTNFVEQKSQQIARVGQVVSDKVYFMKQTIKNACGAMALLHALANSSGQVNIAADSMINKFLDATSVMNSDQRGSYLEQCKDIANLHAECAKGGQTQAPSADENVDLHFVCLANVDGHVYDLDGRKPFPFNCGATSVHSFLKDAAKVCQDYIARDPENLNFSVMALAQTDA